MDASIYHNTYRAYIEIIKIKATTLGSPRNVPFLSLYQELIESYSR